MELKMTARQLERQSQKLEQGEKNERKKIIEVSISLTESTPLLTNSNI